MQRRNRSTCNTVGEQLRAARKANRLTLRAVAKLAGTSHGFIADLEMGRRNASDDVLVRVAAAVGADMKSLVQAVIAARIAAAESRLAELKRTAR